ncbi:hypothetical protein [Paracoccus cavernae]|uniref:hypothetical protein n=1 Tax=Paracoccus cavernae TaxID=1571207 RepID=UPI003630E5CF
MTTPDAAASAPARITAGRPQTGVEAPVAPVAMAPVSEPSDLLPSPAREAPIPIEPPGRVQTPHWTAGPNRFRPRAAMVQRPRVLTSLRGMRRVPVTRAARAKLARPMMMRPQSAPGMTARLRVLLSRSRPL